MSQVANNADDYAVPRVGIFFPAHNQTPNDGNLTGQCVTLVKWFMGEMSSVPNPFSARGDARYVGDTLVAQGHADLVPNGQQKRGDIVVYKYGVYGHIGVLLSNNRFFQENANVAGAKPRTLADGTVVYSSTIVPLYSSLGGAAPTFYRLKTYKEKGGDMALVQTEDEAAELIRGVFKREPTKDEINSMIGRDFKERIIYLRTSEAGQTVQAKVDNFDTMAVQNSQLMDENKQLKEQLSNGSGTYTPVTEQLYTKKAK